MTAEQAAKVLGYERSTIYTMIQRGQVQARRSRGRVRIYEKDNAELFKERREFLNQEAGALQPTTE